MRKGRTLSVIILLAGMLFCFGCAAEADFQFPNGLTSIESEAFCGDESITGLIQIPKSVDTVGKDAFSGTGLYALVVSESVDYLDQQNLSAAYVRFEGQTRTAGLAGVDYVIAPANSPAAVWASQCDDLPWLPEEAVTAQGGFLYLVGEEGATLLSAENGETVGTQAEIPDLVGGKPVTAVMPFAFARIPQLKQVSLPGSMKEACGEALSTAYPSLQIDWREGQGLRILQIRANRSAGSTQNTVTWTVETNDDSAVNSYDYTLRMGDEVIETATGSESAEFTATLPQAGAYQLQVVAVAFDGSSATGTSALYVAEEIMRMILPQTLSGGADLEIAIQPVEGAYSYGVFVTEEETGRYIASRTVTEAEPVTVFGYLLEEGNYRVSGYVYGNLFRYAVPTVKTVTVAGERPAAPGVEKTADDGYGWCTFALSGGNYDLAAACIHSTNGSERTEVREVTENQIYCYAEPSDTVSFSCRENGVWSFWSEGLTVEINGGNQNQLDVPAISLDAESYPEGQDPVITLSGVEHANYYDIRIYAGDHTNGEANWGESLIFKQVRQGGSYSLSPAGLRMGAGTYTVRVYAWDEEDEYRGSYALKSLTVTENANRPAAPEVTVNKREAGAGSTYQFTVGTEGATEVARIRSYTRTNGKTYSYDDKTRAATGTVTSIMEIAEETHIGYVYHHSFAVKIDGIWSEISESIDVTITEREALADPVIHVPDNPKAGQDLVITYDKVPNATSYSIRVEKNGTRISGGSHNFSLGTYTVNGRNLDVGTYKVTVTADDSAGTYASGTSTKTFMVTGTRPVGPEVSADKLILRQGEKATLSIQTDQTDTVYIDWSAGTMDTGYSVGNETLDCWENTTTWLFSPYNWNYSPVTINLFAFYDGVWSQPTVMTVTIDNSEPAELQPAQIQVQEELEAGEDCIISYPSVEHAEKYSIEVLNQAGKTILDTYQTTSLEHVVRGYLLNAGTYTIQVTAEGDGYVSSTATKSFTVSGTKESGPVVTGSETAVRDRYAVFQIGTEGAEAAAVRYYTLGDTYSNFESVSVTGETTSWRKYLYHVPAGTRQGYAFSVKKNGKWSQWSATQVVTITDQEPLGDPSFSLSCEGAGHDLRITIQETENATSYETVVYRNGVRIRQDTYASPRTAVIPGYLIDAGNYRITVTVSDSLGVYASSTGERTLTVSGTRGGKPENVTADRTEVMRREQVTFTVSTAGADKVARCYTTTNDYGRYDIRDVLDTETFWKESQYSAGTYTYCFSCLKNGAWSAWSDPIVITVTEDQRESLAAAQIEINESFENGENIPVRFQAVPNAESYSLSVDDDYGRSIYNSSSVTAGTETFIPGYLLSGGSYTVRVIARSSQYSESEGLRSFTVAGTRPAAPEAVRTATELLSDNGNYWGIDFRVDAEGAEQVICRSWVQGETNLSYRTFTDGFENIRMTRYVNADLVYCYSFSMFRNGKWSAWTPAIRVPLPIAE